MVMEEKTQLNTINRPLVFFFVALLTGLAAAMFFVSGLFFIPLCAASLSALFISERGKRRIFSYLAPILIVVIDAAFNAFYSFNCLVSLLIALILYFCFTKNRAKSECAVYITILISAYTFLAFLLLGFFLTKTFSLESVSEFYSEEFAFIKEQFSVMFEQFAAEESVNPELYSPEYISLMFSELYNSLTALVAVFSFLLCGVTFKIFAAFTKHIPEFCYKKERWIFETSSLFAYFYIALIILSFITATDEFFGILISNLNTVFMFVYAYLGYKFVSAVFANRGLFSRVLLFGAIIFFSGTAIQILSYIGVYFTIITARANNLQKD